MMLCSFSLSTLTHNNTFLQDNRRSEINEETMMDPQVGKAYTPHNHCITFLIWSMRRRKRNRKRKSEQWTWHWHWIFDIRWYRCKSRFLLFSFHFSSRLIALSLLYHHTVVLIVAQRNINQSIEEDRNPMCYTLYHWTSIEQHLKTRKDPRKIKKKSEQIKSTTKKTTKS